MWRQAVVVEEDYCGLTTISSLDLLPRAGSSLLVLYYQLVVNVIKSIVSNQSATSQHYCSTYTSPQLSLRSLKRSK